MDRHLATFSRILAVSVALVHQLSYRAPPVEEHAHLSVLRENQVSRGQCGCAASVDTLLTIIGHVE